MLTDKLVRLVCKDVHIKLHNELYIVLHIELHSGTQIEVHIERCMLKCKQILKHMLERTPGPQRGTFSKVGQSFGHCP